MPGPLLHFGATVTCSHAGQAQPSAPFARVLVSGQPIVMQPMPHIIAGCPFVTGSNPLPCVTGQWTTGALRVKANGMPVLLMDSQATTIPNGVPLLITKTQTRVIGT